MTAIIGAPAPGFTLPTDGGGEAGVLRAEWRKVKVPGHVEAVLEAARAL